MQEQLLHAAEPGRRPAQQFVGVDLRRPKGYAAAVAPASTPPADPTAATKAAAAEGEPCPRCESRDTKFCYYNNYNTSQPRHYCRSCRRYWTKGGSLRNVPVGGGCRKNKRASTSKKSSTAAVTSPISMMPLHQYSRQMAETGLHLSFSGMMPPVTAADPLSSLGLLDWNKYDHILSGSSGFGSANSEVHFTGAGMMGMSSGGGTAA
jgi:hypothetical protein